MGVDRRLRWNHRPDGTGKHAGSGSGGSGRTACGVSCGARAFEPNRGNPGKHARGLSWCGSDVLALTLGWTSLSREIRPIHSVSAKETGGGGALAVPIRGRGRIPVEAHAGNPAPDLDPSRDCAYE